MSDNSISPERLAARWDVKLETLQRWRSEGVGPRFFKTERFVRYHLDDIKSYEKASLRTSVAGAQVLA